MQKQMLPLLTAPASNVSALLPVAGVSSTRKKRHSVSNKAHHGHKGYLKREQRRRERARLKRAKYAKFLKYAPKEEFAILEPNPYRTYLTHLRAANDHFGITQA